jgi:hypothetical protein
MSKGRRQKQKDKKREAQRVLNGYEAGPPPVLVQAPAGGGRGDSVPLSPVQQNKIVSLMIHEPRWQLTAESKGEAVSYTRRNMASDDGRVSNGAVRNLIAMESQNIAWERGDKADAAGNTTNIYVNGDAHFTPDKLRGMSQDELVRVHRETLGLPLADSDQTSG